MCFLTGAWKREDTSSKCLACARCCSRQSALQKSLPSHVSVIDHCSMRQWQSGLLQRNFTGIEAPFSARFSARCLLRNQTPSTDTKSPLIAPIIRDEGACSEVFHIFPRHPFVTDVFTTLSCLEVVWVLCRTGTQEDRRRDCPTTTPIRVLVRPLGARMFLGPMNEVALPKLKELWRRNRAVPVCERTKKRGTGLQRSEQS